MRRSVIIFFLLFSGLCLNAQSENWGENVSEALNSYARDASDIPMTGYPNLQFQMGYSMLLKEFLSIQCDMGGMGGWYITALKSIRKENMVPWLIAGGYYGGNQFNTFYFDFTWTKNNFFGIGAQYSRWFTFHHRLGFFADVHCYFREKSKEFHTLTEFRFGIAYKIFSGRKTK